MVREATISLTVIETIVEDILSKRRELSPDQILALIEEKKREGRGLLSDEGAARLVAEELLVATRGTELGRMRVKDLVPGLNDVNISGRVLLTWPPQDFQRKDGTPGRVMRIILADRSERVRCAVWDRHVDFLLRAGGLQGRVLRVGHAYTRQGLAGDTEVHAGDRSSIEIDPEDMPTSDLPEFGDLFTPLAELAAGANQVNAIGIVQSEPRHYTFTKEDRAGSVLRALVADESGSIPFVAWNERAKELRELKTGDILQALNARVRLDRNGGPELHVESRSQAQILKSPPTYLKPPVARLYRIADLTAQGSVNLFVSVLAVGVPQEIKRPTGETVKVTRLLVSDESGIVSLSLWDDKAELAKGLREGDNVELTGVSVRDRQGENMLSLGKSGRMQKVADKHLTVKGTTKLNALQQSKGLVTVKGTVAETPTPRQVVTERGEQIDLASFMLRDDTGTSRVTFWREQAANALKLRPGTNVKIQGIRVRTGLSGDFELTSIPLSRLEILEGDVKEKPAWEDIRHVIALEPGLNTWIKGVILEVLDDPKIGLACESCGSEMALSETELRCENCKQPRSGRFSLSTNLRLDDGTGVVDVRLICANAAGLTLFDRKDIETQMLKNHTPTIELSRERASILIGKEVELNGTAKPSSDQSKLEFVATRILLASAS
jgi:replication factor A1